MKLLTTQNEYKASNVLLRINGNEIEAYSYGWWKFVTVDTHGNVIFNDATYSTSTNKHQRNVRDVLQRLNIPVGLELRHTLTPLENLNAAVLNEIESLNDAIANIRKAMAVKGSHKRKNAERVEQIKQIEYRIKDLNVYLNEGRLPNEETRHCRLTEDETHGYERYFKKPNGVIQRNEIRAFIKNLQHRRHAPENIDGLKALLKGAPIETLLGYEYCNDLNGMLPAIDTDEHIKLTKFMNKQGIAAATVTAFDLDKMHTFLVNMQNKREYTPREPEPLPVHPIIETLRLVPELKVIDTVQKLRAEGRQQSHCIGGANYIKRCKQGVQALNYKGYTFLLSPELQLIETKGKHNSITPYNITAELSNLLRA